MPEQPTSTDDYKAGEIAKDMVVTNINNRQYTFMGVELGLCNGNSLEYKERKVLPPGIEPGTQGFSVLCSTN